MAHRTPSKQGWHEPTTQPYHPPITAATAADPYPYYAGLVARQALYFDQTLRMWVASSADVVTAVLQHPHCRVRPAAEPVPLALLGSAAAEIFRHLVRMNDGAGHCPFKQAVVGTLEAFRAQQVAEHGDQAAQFLFEQCNLAAEPRRLTEFSFRLPVYVVARWLGMPTENWPHIAIWIDAFVRGIAPGGSVEQVAHGTLAAQHLIDLFHLHLVKQPDQQIDGSSGLALLARQARLIGCTDHAPVIANAIGFITQAYEATAGLIGNTLINLHRQPAIRSQVLADPALLAPLIQEVLRLDPPIQKHAPLSGCRHADRGATAKKPATRYYCCWRLPTATLLSTYIRRTAICAARIAPISASAAVCTLVPVPPLPPASPPQD
ncbi:hypothetical protein ACFS07_16555 [Undibacterium arcticum]